MYRALHPIYEALYKTIDCRFGPDAYELDDDGPNLDAKSLATFARGCPRDLCDIPSLHYPYAFLEWGRVSEVDLYKSPEEYTYQVLYRLFYFLEGKQLQSDEEDSQVFRRGQTAGKEPEFISKSDRNENTKELGVGEFAQSVVDYFWKQHHANRFSQVWDEVNDDPVFPNPPPNDWSIIEFTVDAGILSFSGVTDVTLMSIQECLVESPNLRGIQINFAFDVREREAI